MLMQLNNKQFSRQEALDNITAYHRENGGKCDKDSYINVFKAATKRLKDRGLEHIAQNVWRLNSTSKTENIIDEEVVEYEEIGTGKQIVYLYYYPGYRKLALCEHKDSWCCKIGRTDKSVIDRITSQENTNMPERPFLALIIKCNNSKALEGTIHDVLKRKNKWLANAPGKEWFITSPKEIKERYLKTYEEVFKFT